MTKPGDPRTGRKWMALAAHVIARDRGICARCGHQGADTAGHVLPVKHYPHLALDPNNLRAEHGTKRTLERDGYDCIGNYAAGADTGHTPGEPPPSRDWFTDQPRASADPGFGLGS